ncbi:MAG TPA: phosphoenolpyruvate--protein phosphotransferase [Candidatus Paceibacterota bacterium]|nr:phosphoenolpyruvate--protein phosphotransferase [Candidatus Paceibacterota bacterium]HSA02013.1 phosphoenolpyruvate--protein phosphotransferase [Candidatus Paceibacterota bacterium]
MPTATRLGEKVFRGIPVSPGVCRASVLVLGNRKEEVPAFQLRDEEIPAQIERFEHALVTTRQQIGQIQKQVSAAMGAKDALIFEAHLLLLEDPTLMDETIRLIRDQKVNAEKAFHQVAQKYAETLAAIDDEYLRERAADMRDVCSRVLGNMLGWDYGPDFHQLTQPCIIISQDLTPSTTAQLDRTKILGFATDVGSKTSHTAILARSLEIPAVVGLSDISSQLITGQQVLLDGFNGLVILNPTDQTLFEYGHLVRRQLDLHQKLESVHDAAAITLDGRRIILSANIEQAQDTGSVQAAGAEGVGLFRTEFLYLNRDVLPSEEDQFQAYVQVASALKPQPVVIRTLDLGGDKFLSHLHLPKEMNPFLGWRAIRFCLQERDLFRIQLRAILRASVYGNVKMMYPMISGLDELQQANALVAECQEQLRRDNLPFNDHLEIGAMIEIPSAVLVADALANHVQFFSLGTNDLIQYTLAVDRLNERIAHLYEPTHPAIIKLIHQTVQAAQRHGLWTGLCGEMAGDPSLIPLLLGLGVDELSVACSLVPQTKYLIRRLRFSDTQELAQAAFTCESPSEILARSENLARKAAPCLFKD